jgi:hypothetical protein
MERIKLFEAFISESIENKVRAQLIKFLHEGVRMVPVDVINEGLVDKAQFELELLMNNPEGTPIIKEYVPEVMALVKKFADSGQSGASAPFTSAIIVQVLKKLLAHEPLGDGIMGTDDEWSDCSSYEDAVPGTGSFQNKRLSSVFKEGNGGKPYYLNAITFIPEGKNYGFSSGGVRMAEDSDETVGSAHYIKSFPFEPKTFQIKVHEKEYRKLEDGTLVEEPGGGWWESWLADPGQLDEVWVYYDKKEKRK